MKILFVSQHYWPEPFALADICENLVLRGHEVTVLTGIPNYPEGDIYPDYRKKKNREQCRKGVHIVRAPLIPRKQNPIHRVANYYSFSIAASKVTRSLDSDFDVVIVYQTSPVMMANPAFEYRKRTGAPVLLYCVDIWPECLIAGGIKKNSLIYNHYAKISRKIYSSAQTIAVTSPLFEDYFQKNLHAEVSPVVFLPQYAEDAFTEKANKEIALFDKSKINLTFAGNIGEAQSVETIIQAANLLQDDGRFIFHIVGSGSSEIRCKNLAKKLGLENVIFHGRRPLENMPAYYAASDAMLATFSNSPVLVYTLPRKIQSYLAAGKPILGAVSGEAQRVIEEAQCGFCCHPEDYSELAKICRCFAEADTIRQMGDNAKRYYQDHFTKRQFFKTLEEQLRLIQVQNSNKKQGVEHA